MIDLKTTTHSLLLLHACDYVPSSIPFLANYRCYELHEKCPSQLHVFGHLLPRWWWYYGKLWNL